jgi:hypothetical protein
MRFNKHAVKSVTNKKAPPAFIREEAPLPLVPKVPTKEELAMRKCSKFKIRLNPEDPQDRNTYERLVYIIDGTEEPRIILQWKHDLEVIQKGNGIQEVENMINITRSLCEGAARNWYDAELAVLQANMAPGLVMDMEEHHLAVKAVVRTALPFECLRKQRRYMRRHMRKPRDMKMKTYVGHMMKINQDELPQLPPFGANQSIPQDEMAEIIHSGIPISWQFEMTRQKFVPEEHTLVEMTDFCERLEETEGKQERSNNGSTTQEPRKKHKSGTNGNNEAIQGTKPYCAYHKSHTHSTEECRQKKYHGQQKSDGAFKNKTWKRQADAGRTYTKSEVAALMKKAIAYDRKEGDGKTYKRKPEVAFAELIEEFEDPQVESEVEEEEVNAVSIAEVQPDVDYMSLEKLQDEIDEIDKQIEAMPDAPLKSDDIVEDDEEALKMAKQMEDIDNRLTEFQKEEAIRRVFEVPSDEEFEFE